MRVTQKVFVLRALRFVLLLHTPNNLVYVFYSVIV